MHFGIAKILIDWDASTTSDQRAMHNLVESVRKKFKVAALSLHDSEGIPMGLAVAALSRHENDLNQLVDQILGHCENFGIGRVTWERTLIDHLDSLDD